MGRDERTGRTGRGGDRHPARDRKRRRPGRPRTAADELTAENTWDPPPYRQGAGHRYIWPRRALRRFDPRYWVRRVHVRATIRMVHHPASHGDYQQIEMMLGDVQVGRLDYMICTDCRIGFVGKISIDPDMQGRGLGTRALELARRQAVGLRWCTSGQYVTARTFWRSVGRRTGDSYQPANDDLRPCAHMDPRPGRQG